MPEDPDLDSLIDAALETYADRSADANLAERILSRLANEPAPKMRPGWLPWAAVAFPAAICLLLLAYFGWGTADSHTAPDIQGAQLHNPAGPSVRPQAIWTAEPARTRHINHVALLQHSLADTAKLQPPPKLDVFPTPTPLTRQERALAVYVAHTPRAEQQALARSEQEQTPLTVASIHVIPLDSSDDDVNTN
jgi:hypothetical protein